MSMFISKQFVEPGLIVTIYSGFSDKNGSFRLQKWIML